MCGGGGGGGGEGGERRIRVAPTFASLAYTWPDQRLIS